MPTEGVRWTLACKVVKTGAYILTVPAPVAFLSMQSSKSSA